MNGRKIVEVESHVIGDAHLVRLRTDDGASGVGQSGCWGYPAAVAQVVDTFRGYLLGQDPDRIESHWHHMYRMGAFRGSILGGAVSAVDIALWDLKGQRLDVPVWELLGGRYRERVRLMYLLEGTSSVDELVAYAAAAVAKGFSAVKFAPLPAGWYEKPLSSLITSMVGAVSAVRETIGWEVDIVLEFGKAFTPNQASPIIDALAPLSPLFVEDPIPIDSIEIQADLARKSRVPLGQGERMHSIWEFEDLLARGGSQYLRACPGLAGGISHCKKIAAVAEAHHSSMVWHNYQGPILTAACVHLDAAIPNFALQEWYPQSDEGHYASGYTSSLVREGGELIVPDAPGLGIDFDETQLIPHDLTGREHLWQIPQRSDGSVAFAV